MVEKNFAVKPATMLPVINLIWRGTRKSMTDPLPQAILTIKMVTFLNPKTCRANKMEARKERGNMDNDSFEDISDEENEDIEVSELDHDTRIAGNITEHDTANSNMFVSRCPNNSLRDNVHHSPKQFEKQVGAFDRNKRANACQVSAFDKVNHNSPTKENTGKYKCDNEKSELFSKRAFEYSSELLAKTPSNVCTRCSVPFRSEHELANHKTMCVAERNVASGSKYESHDPLRVTKVPETRKRRRSTHEDEQGAIRSNGPHHLSKRWVFPTTRAEIVALANAPDTSPYHHCLAASSNRVSVITPHDALDHERFNSTRKIPHTPNINFKVDLPKVPSTHHPSISVQKLRVSHSEEDQQNKQCLLPIRKPAEHDAKELDGFGKEPDQRDAAKHMINDVDGSQQQSSHEHSDDDLDDKALPLKKRCVLTK